MHRIKNIFFKTDQTSFVKPNAIAGVNSSLTTPTCKFDGALGVEVFAELRRRKDYY